MNYRYIYPLYEDAKTDGEEAHIFIIKKMLENQEEKILYNEAEELDSYELDRAIYDHSRLGTIRNVYGVNFITMANCFKVEDIFFKDIRHKLLNYLTLNGHKAECISIKASDIASKKIIHNINTKPGYIPISKWPPFEKWLSLEYSSNKDANLFSPMNQCIHSFIHLTNFSNREFVDSLRMYNIDHIYDNTENELYIKALPASSYNPVLRLMNLVFKYL